MSNTIPTPAEQALARATAEVADSEQRLAETHELVAEGQSGLVAAVVELAYQLGRAQGTADGIRGRLAEMLAKHAAEHPETDTP